MTNVDTVKQPQPTGTGDYEGPPRQRVRLTYAKQERIKFISHQDEFRAWERSLRRANLPLLYKRGFNPQPHIQFASPLGVGFSGNRETVDIILAPPVALAELRQRLTASLPPGLVVHDLVETPLKTPALQSLLIGADYSIRLFAENEADGGETFAAMLRDKIAAFLATQEIWRERERKGKRYRYNLRPLVLELHYRGFNAEDEAHDIFLRVQQRSGATGRPDEVVSALELNDYPRSLCRDRLYLENNAEDDALFAAYPVIAKADIAEQPLAPAAHAASSRTLKGRTIGERAGDEFI